MADPKHPHHYDEAFKRQIVQLYANGKPSRETGAEYDIARSTPRRWVQAIRNSGSTRADVQVFRTDRGSEFDNTRIDELLDVFGIKRSLSRKGNPYDNAVVESTNRLLKKELVYRNSYATIEQLRRDPRRLRVVVRRPAAPLHPRIPKPEGIHRTRTRPLGNCPTHRCQSIRGIHPGRVPEHVPRGLGKHPN